MPKISGRARHTQTTVELPPLSNYAYSPLRWQYDAALAEFKALRDEMILTRDHMEKTHYSLLTLLGAVIASQVVSGSVTSALDRHPIVYLLTAILSFWFPANYTCLAIDMTMIGSYLRDTLGPHLRSLTTSAVAAASEDGFATTAELLALSKDIGRILPEHLRTKIVEPLGWEEWIPLQRLETRGRVPSILIYVLRDSFLFAPAIGLVILYFQHLQAFGLGDWLGLTCVAVEGCIALLIGLGGRSMTAYSVRRGVFRVREESSTS
jgi:hypothetical protein